MLAGPVARIACGLAWLISVDAAGDDSARGPKPAATLAPRGPEPANLSPVVPPPGDPAAARAEADARLKELSRIEANGLTLAQKTLRDEATARLGWIEKWEKAVAERRAAEDPNPAPDREAADRRADLDRARTMLDQAMKSPESLVPERFRLGGEAIDEARMAELREAIDGARANLKEAEEAGRPRVDAATQATLLAKLREGRDNAHARSTALAPRRAKAEAEYAGAKSEDDRRIARERLINDNWEVAVEGERLRLAEASLDLEARRGPSIELAMQAQALRVALARARLDGLVDRYRAGSERKKKALDREAAAEQSRAATIDDPLEKYQARRQAEVLALQSQHVEYQKLLSAPTNLSLEDQTRLADRAQVDFSSLKEIVKANRGGGLVALRLNNDFRRIARERTTILRNEFAQSSASNTYFENALTEAELESFNDARDDRSEHEALLATLPPSRRAAADAVVEEIERKHREALAEIRRDLEKLLARAEATHIQVDRRLRILDEQYAFIRTNIFWVRDSEPIGESTIRLAKREAARLASALVRLAAMPLKRSLWSPASAEFGLAMAGLVAFPAAILQARRRLKAIKV